MPVENNNYTINSVEYIITESAVIVDELGQNFIELTIIPNSNYTVTASDFSLATPANATYVTSVVFTQSGDNVLVTINLVTTAVMPQENLDLGICISGSAQLAELTIDGVYNTEVESQILPASETNVAYSATGDQGDLTTLFTKTFAANSGFYITTTSVVVTQGNAANYSFEEAPVYNGDGYMTSVTYTVKYLFPSESISGDIIDFTIRDKGIPVVQPSVISSYSELPPWVAAVGENVGWTVFGEPGAQYSATMLGDDGTSVTIATNEVIPASGQYFQVIEFPAWTSSGVRIWTITLTGDLASPFIQPNPFTVNQYANIELTITGESSDANVSYASSEIIEVPALQTVGPVISQNIEATINVSTGNILEIVPNALGKYKEDISIVGGLSGPLTNASTLNFTLFDENFGTLQVGDRFNFSANDPLNNNNNEAPFTYSVTSVSGTAPNYTVGITPPLTTTAAGISVSFFRLNGNIADQINPILLTQITPQSISIDYVFTLLRSGDQDTTFTLDLDDLITVRSSGSGSQAIQTCFALKENDLCCQTPVSKTIYIPSNETFNTANVFYDDANLTIVSSAGFYSVDINCSIP